MKTIMLLLATLALTSCGTFKQVLISEPYTPAYLLPIEGKVVGILPVEISFSGLHATLLDIDMRDVSLTIGGQKVDFGNYLLTDTSEDLGTYGVLDTNIFEKSGMDTQPLSELVTSLIQARLMGLHDFQMGFFKGFGKGEMGLLSSRALEALPNSYPTHYNYIGDPIPVLAKDVIRVKDIATSPDFFIEARLALGSELVEILEAPDEGGKTSDEIKKLPKVGDYYLVLKGFLEFSVIDRAGKVLYTDSTPLDHPVNNVANELIKMPFGKGNVDGYYKYFREQNFEPFAIAVINKFLPGIYPHISPYYVNTFVTVEDKE